MAERAPESRKNPMGTFADAINRSFAGEPGALTKGGCLARIVVTIGILALLKYFFG